MLLTVLVEDLGTSLEPDWLLEGDTVLCQQLGEDASQSSEHGPPGVDDLDLPAKSLELCKEMNRLAQLPHSRRRDNASPDQPSASGTNRPSTIPVAGEGLGVCGQTGCVPAVVTSELTAQVVGGDTLAEGTCRHRHTQVSIPVYLIQSTRFG